jgi:hypothetical protein
MPFARLKRSGEQIGVKSGDATRDRQKMNTGQILPGR